MRLGRRITVAVVVGAVTLAGCTGREPEVVETRDTGSGTVAPRPSPGPTTSPTATPATPSPPAPPPDLARADEAGAAAAAQYFVSLYSYTMQTGDTAAWTQMSADVCGFCGRIKADAEAIAANGETYVGGDILLSEVTVLPQDELVGGFPVDASFTQAPARHTDAEGTVINETAGDSGPVRIDTLNSAGSWRVLAVVVGGLQE
ncbi:DUF6318 family protein [Cellulomonas aerilata]|uniref:DUF6318 domain-containing protein n=1 Tax=Cellulomonas aerilata TaxID=515326 RepID=A0A512D8K9_9CELL|nr:DUF6318 family protein [Cellulomonas aerilata]GEO32806.1 hypothetical protein CAE01nite_05310 [Cellulomonas aerilata]